MKRLRWRDCFKVGISIFGLYLAINYWKTAANLASAIVGASLPLIIGGSIAYFVNILMANYERHWKDTPKRPGLMKLRRPVCMSLAFLTLIALVTLVFWLIIPQLVDCVMLIIAELPGFITDVIDFAEERNLFSEEVLTSLEAINWTDQIGNLVGMVTTGIGDVVGLVLSAVSSVFSFLVTTLLSLIFAIYLLAGKETFFGQTDRLARRYLSERIYGKITYVLHIVDDCFHRYIVGQCIEAVILGVLCAIGMLILRLPYALMVGTLVGFTALIPVAGAYIGAGVGAFMILLVDPLKALIFLIFILVLQQLEGNLIYPKVVGSSMGLPGIWVLAAVTVGGSLAGILGMLLGVPLAAAIYRIVREDVRKGKPRNPVTETAVKEE
ncbi:MAG: AI-2E family transporter [Oscillospiraceae bacterium]|nr:AI-2E family transporter [Oscillospiraceae bacterium]